MDNKFIPADIQRFIVETIDSVAQLEALLLLLRRKMEYSGVGPERSRQPLPVKKWRGRLLETILFRRRRISG